VISQGCTSTLSTRASDGPERLQRSRAFTASVGPSAWKTTERSGRFLTQPQTPSSTAALCMEYLKLTPCTRPCTQPVKATCAGFVMEGSIVIAFGSIEKRPLRGGHWTPRIVCLTGLFSPAGAIAPTGNAVSIG